MPGWEALVRISFADSWATPGTFGKRGIFLNVDSTDLDLGAKLTERDGKILGIRESLYDSVSFDSLTPTGGFTFQPRVDDLLPILMAHFQNCATAQAGGTYTFYRAPTSLNWLEGGSNFGTHPYSLNVDLVLGNWGTNNGIRFMNGIVDKLTFGVKFGGDLVCTPTFKFLTGSVWTYPAGFVPTSAYGSLSGFSRLVDYMGTLTLGNFAYNFESWTGNFNNNTSNQSRLGRRGYTKFPFSGRWIADGEVEYEVTSEIGTVAAGNANGLVVDLKQGVNNSIQINQPNVVYKNSNPNVSSGDAPIMRTLLYRAYPPSGTTGPSTQLIVNTGTLFGKDLFGSFYT